MEAGAVVTDTSHGLSPGRLLGFDSAGQQEGEPKEGENCSHDSLRKKVGWEPLRIPACGAQKDRLAPRGLPEAGLQVLQSPSHNAHGYSSVRRSGLIPTKSTKAIKFGTSRLGIALDGFVAPPPSFPARLFTQTDLSPSSAAGATS